MSNRALIKSRLASVMHLLTGNFGIAGIMLLSMSLAARSLGPAQFGAMALVLATGRVSERLLRFEAWQPLIRFVAAEEEGASPHRLARLYAYGLMLDVASAVLAAILSVVFGIVAGSAIGLQPDQIGLVAIYACAIALNIRGMSSAALRMSGKFRTLAYIQLAGGLLRLALALVLYLNGAGLRDFIIVWTVAQIFDALLFNIIGFRTLHQRAIPNPLRVSWLGLPSQFPGFLRFAFSTNLSSTMRTLTHEADTLLVGFFAGPGAAGLYHLSRRIAKVAQQSGDMIQTVIYPDLARMWAAMKLARVKKMVRWVQIAMAGFGVAALVAIGILGKPLLGMLFGESYVAAWPLLMTQVVAVTLLLHAAPSRSALLAMNRPTYVLGVAFASTVIFFAVALYALPQFGAIGANYAHIAFGLTTAICLDLALWFQFRHHQAGQIPELARGEDQ